MLGMTNTVIAKMYNVSVRTIEDDNKFNRENIKNRLKSDFDEILDKGSTLARLEKMREMLWSQYIVSKNEAFKFQIISKVQNIEEQLERIKINTGLWSRAPINIKNTFEQRVIQMRAERKIALEPKKIYDGKLIAHKKKNGDSNSDSGGIVDITDLVKKDNDNSANQNK